VAAQVLGQHFFTPPHMMRLVECVRGRHTSDDAIATVAAVTRRMNKVGGDDDEDAEDEDEDDVDAEDQEEEEEDDDDDEDNDLDDDHVDDHDDYGSQVFVLVGNCHGFVGNRCSFPFMAEAEALVMEGCSPYDVDRSADRAISPLSYVL
jgi:3-hydroxyacyl-CoA dehydrogenase